MNQEEALKLIDDYKNKLINPIEMLRWTWLRAIINQIPPEYWERYVDRATEVLSR